MREECEEKIMQYISIFCNSAILSPPYPHYLRGTWGLQKIAKKGGELRAFIKKSGYKKERDPVKVGVGCLIFWFQCSNPQADIKAGMLY